MPHLAYLGQGNNYHVKKWLPALVEQGLEVTLISFSAPESEVPGVAFRQIEPPFGKPGRLHLWDFWGNPKPTTRLLDEIDADVLMASYATNYGFLGARTGFRPLIAQTWTADLTVYPVAGWKRWILRPMVNRSLRDADVITTDGSALAEQGRMQFPGLADRFVAVRWGIRLADFDDSSDVRAETRQAMKIPAEAPVITSARGVLPWYRPEVVVQAILSVLDATPDVHALVLTLGRGRDDEVQVLLDRCERHPRCHLVDRFIPADQMRQVWAATDIVISIPEVDGVSEGLLEGMYCGCIPLVSDIPSNRSIIEDQLNGVILKGDPESPADAARELEEMVGRLDELKSTIPQRNHDWVRDHASIEATAAQMASLVKSLLSPD